MLDHLAQCLVGEDQLLCLQSVRLHLLWYQVALGDLHLLVLGVTLQPNDLHAVHQRLRHVERVGSRHKHHVGKIVIELQIMVLELVVLLGVQHLQQRR